MKSDNYIVVTDLSTITTFTNETTRFDMYGSKLGFWPIIHSPLKYGYGTSVLCTIEGWGFEGTGNNEKCHIYGYGICINGYNNIRITVGVNVLWINKNYLNQ